MEIRGLGDEAGVEGHAEEHEGQRREEPAGPSGPEGLEAHATGAPFGQQQRGDQITGQDEEEVDTQIAALQR